MSSLARRVQIRALKRSGYRRTKEEIVVDRGNLQVRPVRRGSLIRNPKGEIVGKRWPGIPRASTGLEPLAAVLAR